LTSYKTERLYGCRARALFCYIIFNYQAMFKPFTAFKLEGFIMIKQLLMLCYISNRRACSLRVRLDKNVKINPRGRGKTGGTPRNGVRETYVSSLKPRVCVAETETAEEPLPNWNPAKRNY
jgi:hypothetical protein